MKEKKKILLVLGILIAVISVVGVSYAAWQLTKVQSGTNVVTSGCFKVEFTDQNPISLLNAYPIKTEEGKTLTPYEFTITNTCNSEANYQINLEILNDSTFTELMYIREMLNEKGSTSGSRILSRNKEVEKTIENASSSYKLNQGVLAGNESKTFEFRLWLDEDTPAIPSVMNKEFNSKITVTTSLKLPVDTTNMMVAMDIDESTMANNTYTQGDKYKSTLTKVIFESVKDPIEGAKEVKDFSVNQDESVLGYYVENDDQTEVVLHIQAAGKIKVNTNGSFYFSPVDSGDLYTFEGFENLDTSEVTNMSNMFYRSYSDLRREEPINLDLSSFDTSKVMDMSSMFANSLIDHLNLSSFDTSNVTDMSGMFEEVHGLTGLLTNIDVSSFDTSNVIDMSSMFRGMSELTSLDLSHFDTSNVTNMEAMFLECSSLTNLDLSSFDTSRVTSMGSMFDSMASLMSLDLSHFDTSSVTDMSGMFVECNHLEHLDISGFDTSNVTSMNGMFANCVSLTSLDVSFFDTSNVTDTSSMFQNMYNLESLDLRNFDTSNVTDISGMFRGASNLTNITYGNRFLYKEGANVNGMYDECPAEKPTDGSWNSVFPNSGEDVEGGAD